MAAWFALPIATKLVDAGLILLMFGVFAGTIFMFVRFLFNQSKKNNVSVKTPLGTIGKEDAAASPTSQVQINVNTSKPIEEAEECLEEARYESPAGVPGFMEHRFFRLMDKALDGKVVKLKAKSASTEMADIKNKAFSYFLFECKTRIFRDMIEEFVNDCLCTFGKREILSSIIQRTSRAIHNYEAAARKAQVEIDKDRILLNIPDIMIDKFNEWHQTHVDITLNKLESIVESQFYPTWQLKLISILDTFETIFAVTFDYAEYSLSTLNGELDDALKKNIVYRRTPIN